VCKLFDPFTAVCVHGEYDKYRENIVYYVNFYYVHKSGSRLLWKKDEKRTMKFTSPKEATATAEQIAEEDNIQMFAFNERIHNREYNDGLS